MSITNPNKLSLFLVLSLFAVHFALADDSSRKESLAQPEDRILVGVNYFAGWWKPLPNKWIAPDGKDWREKYPGRVPLLGEYNEQEMMDREIAVASEYGVDFFLMLWYFNGIDNAKERGEHTRLLNVGIEQFMKSPNAGRMKFAVEYCNHEPFQIREQADWDWAVKTWVEMMKHPSYLRVGGKPLFKVHSWHHYWFENGENLEQCMARMQQLRQAARDAGLGEILIGAGIGSYQKITSSEDRIAKLFDFTSTYMELPDLPIREGNDYPYESLAEFMRDSRKVHGDDAILYLPYFGLNFNAEPWGDHRARFKFPTREQLKMELQRLKADMENAKLNLGVPLGNEKRQKVFTIYAWNEFGEGGFLAPTVEEKMMKLEVLKEVFARESKSK
ncbi:MAG: glycoside hydrolase family 99-like domain-containing protein [Planctomycetaceae bacterium]|nr:glycoside hydrolase family 99-like domain-containing protein [Planctomycetaceae bacterium]